MAVSAKVIVNIFKDNTNHLIGSIDFNNLLCGASGPPGVGGTLSVTGIETYDYYKGLVNVVLVSNLPDPASVPYGTQVIIRQSGYVHFRERNPTRWIPNGRIIIG